MANKLTKKEKGFADDYIETGNGTQSVLNNYDTDDENVAGVMASQNLGKLKIINYIESKLPDELLAQVHLEGLGASKTIIKGEEQIDEPDYGIRHKYLETAYKIKGSFAPDKSINLNIDVETTDPETQAKAKAFDEWYTNQP